MRRVLLLLISTMLFSMATTFADDGGTTGPLTWTFTTATGTLTISGNGDMPDYFDCQGTPWYQYQNSITAINIGSGVLKIGNNAFCNCAITSIIIPGNVNFIGRAAFSFCGNLQNVKIDYAFLPLSFDAGWVSSDAPSYRAFYESSIGNLQLLRNISYNDRYKPFEENQKLISLEIGDKVTYIDIGCFSGCAELISVEFGSELEEIRDDSFKGCTKLPSVECGSKCSMGNNAFYGCTKLVNAIISEVTKIGDNAFCGTGLTSITIPGTVTSIGRAAFSFCGNLQNVIIDYGFQPLTFDAGWVSSDAPSYRAFSEGSIGNLQLLRNIEYNDRYKPFEDNRKLTSLEIGEKVTSIGYGCFSGCSSITKITSHPCPPPIITYNTFSGVNKEIPVYVNCCSAYQAEQYWNGFTNYWSIDAQEQCGVGIEYITSPQFLISPNPTTGELKMENGKLKIENVIIFDVYGRELLFHTSSTSSKMTIDISHFSAGIYFVKIHTETGEVVRKVLKE